MAQTDNPFSKVDPARFIDAVSYSTIAPSALPFSAKHLAARLRDRVDEHGIVLVDEVPVIALEARSSSEARTLRNPKTIRLMPYPWQFACGDILTLTLMAPGMSYKSPGPFRVGISPDDVRYEAFAQGRVYLAVFFRGDAILARDVNFRATSTTSSVFDGILGALGNREALLQDDKAALCASLPKEMLTDPIRRLCFGWVDHYIEVLEVAAQVLQKVRGATTPRDELRRVFTEIVQSFKEAVDNGSGTDVLKAFHAELAAAREQYDLPHELMVLLFEMFFAHSAQSNEGKQIQWFDDRTGALESLVLYPVHFRSGYDAANYWKGHRLPFNLSLGSLCEGTDSLLTPDQTKAMAKVPWGLDTPDEAFSAAFELLQEGLANKRGSVPPRALVRFEIGPFAAFEVLESRVDAFVKLITPEGDCLLVILNINKHSTVSEFRDTFLQYGEMTEHQAAAVALVLAATLRDFWVVEDREVVFGTAKERSPGPRHPAEGRPRIVYLPRVRYQRSANVGGCREALKLQQRREHSVRAHLRRSSTCTDLQRALATRYGYTLEEGFTFVRPHERGIVKRQVEYRSRSALQLLFRADATRKENDAPEWFRFERDMHRALSQLGFVVEHVAANRSGDGGVDLLAKGGEGLTEVVWVVQCKLRRPDRILGPSAVRELAGTLQEYPRGVRGLLITTGSFSAEAKRVAEVNDIRLIDGSQLATLLE